MSVTTRRTVTGSDQGPVGPGKTHVSIVTKRRASTTLTMQPDAPRPAAPLENAGNALIDALPAVGRRTSIKRDGINLRSLARSMCSLANVKHLDEIGTKGPLAASAGKDSLYNCLFGRDSIRMAMDLADTFPLVSEKTIVALAELQGVGWNARAEEEPGRIIHEARPPSDPLYAELAKNWDLPYYGAVDSTPNFVNLVALHVKHHGPAILDRRFVDKAGQEITVREAVERATEWILRRMDKGGGFITETPTGYVTVCRANPAGIPNQVWEDSGDSYYDETGKLVDFDKPYAPIAVQGYAYDALQGAARMLGGDQARALTARASRLKAQVLEQMWLPEMSTFALALTFDQADGQKGRPLKVATSSPGHLLTSGMLDGDELKPIREALVHRLMEPDLLGAEGIRTKSTTAPRFRPGSYHNGSSWPMDTGVVAEGMRRSGFEKEARELEDRMLKACAKIGGFPEFFRGDLDGVVRVNRKIVDAIVDGKPNRLEQPPQKNQGWSVTRVFKILVERGYYDDIVKAAGR